MQIVHADRWNGCRASGASTIHTSVQYGYDKVEDLIAVFQARPRF